MMCPIDRPRRFVRARYHCLCCCAFLASLSYLKADSTFVYAVQISAAIQTSPSQITLMWEPDPYGANSYTIYRKAKEDTSWGTPLATLSGSDSSYTDTSVAEGSTYEYQIVKAATLGYTGYGYIYSGINAPLVDQRGTLLLIVAAETASNLQVELSQLETDLVGDGWQVRRHEVSTNDTPDYVRALIIADYLADPTNVNTVFLFGHVPILQSGFLDYDGHGARPMPADAFYGELNNDWPTDPTNSPSFLPSDAVLSVGRVDFANMPGNGAPFAWPSEEELLRNYLLKDHEWRHGTLKVPRRALMGNRRGDEDGLATAASGYRNFEPLVGPGNIIEANIADTAPIGQRWVSMLATNRYLWAYGCGAGQDTAIGYLGTHGTDAEVWSMDIVEENAQAVFVMVFGSHFGNWDHTDNIMRAVLATPGIGLACWMAGRPHWFCHHMGLGEPIGYSARLTLNNSSLYQNQTNPLTRAVYISLMGDPTLRMEPIIAPENLAVTNDDGGVHLNWTAPAATINGYHVYRALQSAGPFQRLTGALIPGTNYIDNTAAPGSYVYMVRAITLQSNPSGSYFNPSQGSLAAITVARSPTPISLHVTKNANHVTLDWNAQAGMVYGVDAIDNLAGTNWLDLTGGIPAATNHMTWADSPTNAGSMRFYRVRTH